MASNLAAFSQQKMQDIIVALGACSPDHHSPHDNRLNGCRSAFRTVSTSSTCEAPPQARDTEIHGGTGNAIPSGSSTDLSDSEARPFLLPAGVEGVSKDAAGLIRVGEVGAGRGDERADMGRGGGG